MKKQDIIETLQRARDEVVQLRAEVSVLRPKAELYDRLFFPAPRGGGIMGRNVVYDIDRVLDTYAEAVAAEALKAEMAMAEDALARSKNDA